MLYKDQYKKTCLSSNFLLLFLLLLHSYTPTHTQTLLLRYLKKNCLDLMKYKKLKKKQTKNKKKTMKKMTNVCIKIYNFVCRRRKKSHGWY